MRTLKDARLDYLIDFTCARIRVVLSGPAKDKLNVGWHILEDHFEQLADMEKSGTPMEVLVPIPIAEKLFQSGIETVEQLQRISYSQLRQRPQIGTRTARIICEALRSVGIELANTEAKTCQTMQSS